MGMRLIKRERAQTSKKVGLSNLPKQVVDTLLQPRRTASGPACQVRPGMSRLSRPRIRSIQHYIFAVVAELIGPTWRRCAEWGWGGDRFAGGTGQTREK